MSDETVSNVLEAAASNPKVATTVAVTLNALGTAALLSQLQTILGLVSLGIGCAIGIYALRCNITKNKIYERMLKDGESLKE